MDESTEAIRTEHRLHAADSRNLSMVPDSSVQLVVTSPPYPMLGLWDGPLSMLDPLVARALQEERGSEAFDLMHRAVLEPVWREAWRVLAPGGFLCVNIGDSLRTIAGNFRMYPNGARVLADCHAIGFDILPEILWRKPTNAPNKFMGSGVLPAGAYVTLEHEHILVMRKGGKREFADDEARARRLESALFWEERNIWFSDIWDFRGSPQTLGKRISEEAAMLPPPDAAVDGMPEPQPFQPEPTTQPRDRSAAFPLELAERLILMYSVQGDTVLDPFLGTATTTLAAMGTGRSSVGVDIEPELVAFGLRRAGQEVPELNRRVADRVARHRAWTKDYEARHPGSLRHRNGRYGLPVMSAQEERIALTYIAALQAEPDPAHPRLHATHRLYHG